jgi:hypothetical protein
MARSPEQQKKSNDRAHARREKKRMAAEGGAVDTKTGERYEIAVLDNDSPKAKRLAPVVEQNMRTLRAPEASTVREKTVEKRVRYAAMRTHMEIAANVLASGGTAGQAARKAGVHRRQIRKYMENPDFRDRIAELQETLGGRIRGKIIKEINRRTSPKVMKKMDTLDVLRIGDRFGLGRGAGSVIVNDNREIHNYETTIAALFGNGGPQDDPYAEEEGEDFPTFEPDGVPIPGGDTPVDG